MPSKSVVSYKVNVFNHDFASKCREFQSVLSKFNSVKRDQKSLIEVWKRKKLKIQRRNQCFMGRINNHRLISCNFIHYMSH